MVQSTKTFRVFVSSTFSDLKEERNILRKKVFPKIHELCREHGCSFQAIDLRWGVSEEASLDQQTMEICFEEIERCQKTTPKPNFIILLGDRYGWRPVPSKIPVGEFDEIYKRTKDELDKQLLKEWFRRDDNAVPPIYDLQPRIGEYEDYNTWTKIENKLNSIIRKTVLKLNLPEKNQIKYYTSASEQEIINGALQVEDAEEHVFAFFRKIKNRTEVNNESDYFEINVETNKLLKNLKTKINHRIPENIFEYEAYLTKGKISTEHLDKLSQDVYKSLSEIILKEIEEFETTDELIKEIDDHSKFGLERAKFFTGRTEIIKTINDYINSSNKYPLVIYGDSGSGKTALMAHTIKQLSKENPEANIIHRFIGATPNSTDIVSLLEGLCKQIYRLYDKEESFISKEYQLLLGTFNYSLSFATTENPLIIFIDALDQLANWENAQKLFWLPQKLPENVHLILTTLNTDQIEIFTDKLSNENISELSGLKTAEGEELLESWLKNAGRTLQKNQNNYLINKFRKNPLPLYLKIAFEEAVKWKSYNEYSIKDDVSGIIFDFIERLSKESNHGKVFVQKTLGYLAASRYGLTENEIINVLSFDKEVLDDFKRRSPRSPNVNKLPTVIWSRLFFDMEPYLYQRNASGYFVFNFYHKQLKQVIQSEYLSQEEKKYHKLLASYFKSQPFSSRTVDEVPWEMYKAESWEELKEGLTDFHIFVELNQDNRRNELIKYWNSLKDKYNLVEEYKDKIKLIKENTSEDNLASYYFELGVFLYFNGLYEDAEPFYRDSLQIRIKRYGEENLDTAASMNKLGLLLRATGENNKEAEDLYRNAIRIREKLLGEYHPDTAMSINNLANLLRGTGRLDEAEELYKKSLEIHKKTLGPEHPDTGTVINNLGILLERKGDLEGAEKLYSQSMEIYEKHNPQHEFAVLGIINLADIFQTRGEYDKAEKFYKCGLKKREIILGSEHPLTLATQADLANLLLEKKDYEQAETLYRKNLKIKEKTLGPKHPSTAATLITLANLCMKNKRDYQKAEILYKKALKIQEKTIWSENLLTATIISTALKNLALILINKGNYDEAKHLYEKSLKICEKDLGPNHPFTIEIEKQMSIFHPLIKILNRSKKVIKKKNDEKKTWLKFWK